MKAVAAIPAGDPLARRETLGPKDFEDRSFVSLGPATLFRSRVEAALAGVRRRQLIETQLSEIACVLVAEKAGLSLVDPFSASEFIGRGVVFRAFRPDIFFDAAILLPEGRPISALALEFLDTFRDAFRRSCALCPVTPDSRRGRGPARDLHRGAGAAQRRVERIELCADLPRLVHQDLGDHGIALGRHPIGRAADTQRRDSASVGGQGSERRGPPCRGSILARRRKNPSLRTRAISVRRKASSNPAKSRMRGRL